MKKKLFIAISGVIDQGGISTSIQNLLALIHNEYEVTLCAINDYISPNIVLPSDVKVLNGSQMIGYAIMNRKLFQSQGPIRRLKIFYARFIRRIKGMDYVVSKGIIKMPLPDVMYDTAIAFSGNQYDVKGHLIVGGDYELISKRIKAKRKVAWMHNDLRKAGYTREIALRVYRDFDAIVAVSVDNKRLIDDMVPEYKSKTHVVYNTYNLQRIIKLSKAFNPYKGTEKLHFVTVARLDLRQKRQDRIIEACSKLKKEGFYSFDWYLVGDGAIETLRKMAEEKDVTDLIHFVGLQTNPYPYMLHADAFVLTSQFEGYGMTIKEAQILGCPTLVTDFGPAHEAVEDGLQGIICENSSEGVYNMIKYIIQNNSLLKKYRKYIKEHPVNNEISLTQFKMVCEFNL